MDVFCLALMEVYGLYNSSISHCSIVNRELPVVAQPAGIPGTMGEHAKLMFDLMALAYETDLTRVTTFMLGREITGRTYAEIGVPDAHHPISHHQKDPEKLAKLTKINQYHAQLFAEFLERLRTTPDGDGSLPRPLHDRLRRRNGRQQHPRVAESADSARRRGERAPAGTTSGIRKTRRWQTST